MTKIDRRKLRREYICGNMSYKALGKKYGVFGSYVARIGAREHWVSDRKAFRIKVHLIAMEKLSDLESNK